MAAAAMRRVLRPFTVVALILALGGSAWAQCLTGDLTPEQKACCAAMNHDCGAAGVEMGCCPTEPQTQDRVQAVSIKPELLLPALLTGPLALLPEPQARVHLVAAGSFDREALKLPDRPRYLLLSVFLI
jgi:nitroreductase